MIHTSVFSNKFGYSSQKGCAVAFGFLNLMFCIEEEMDSRKIQLDLATMHREGQRQMLINKLLKSAKSVNVEVHAAFGHACYFEAEFKNPFDVEETFQLHWKDDELRVVTDEEEWNNYRILWNASSALPRVERDMICKESKRITLAPHETVSLPFVFQSFQSGLVATRQLVNHSAAVEARSISVDICGCVKKHSVLTINIVVMPRQFPVTQELRLACPRGELLRSSVKIRGESERFVCASCSDVAVDWKCPDELSVKFRQKAEFSDFYVLVYNDRFHADLYGIYHFCVQQMERIDLHGVAGQKCRKEILIEGDTFARKVRCYSDCPGEVVTFPRKKFQLVAGVLNKVELEICPQARVGNVERLIRVHLLIVTRMN